MKIIWLDHTIVVDGAWKSLDLIAAATVAVVAWVALDNPGLQVVVSEEVVVAAVASLLLLDLNFSNNGWKGGKPRHVWMDALL
ncbi:unnamed protein product [Camellia sinensis]